MADYQDRLNDEEWFARELDELEKLRAANEWERRLRQLVARLNQSPDRNATRATVLRDRSRIINYARLVRPDFSEVSAAAWVDGVLGLDPKH